MSKIYYSTEKGNISNHVFMSEGIETVYSEYVKMIYKGKPKTIVNNIQEVEVLSIVTQPHTSLCEIAFENETRKEKVIVNIKHIMKLIQKINNTNVRVVITDSNEKKRMQEYFYQYIAVYNKGTIREPLNQFILNLI